LLLAAGLSCACAGYGVAGYSPSAATASAANAALRGAKVRVGPFAAKGPAENGLMCRASGRIQVEDGPSFADFLRRALIVEVRSAGALSDQAPVTLTGTVTRFEFSTVMPMGAWTLELTLTSSNGSAVTATEVYDFDVGRVGGDDPCALTAAAAVPAVQHLITRILKHPNFADLLK
jgi:hypothetical protein